MHFLEEMNDRDRLPYGKAGGLEWLPLVLVVLMQLDVMGRNGLGAKFSQNW